MESRGLREVRNIGHWVLFVASWARLVQLVARVSMRTNWPGLTLIVKGFGIHFADSAVDVVRFKLRDRLRYCLEWTFTPHPCEVCHTIIYLLWDFEFNQICFQLCIHS